MLRNERAHASASILFYRRLSLFLDALRSPIQDAQVPCFVPWTSSSCVSACAPLRCESGCDPSVVLFCFVSPSFFFPGCHSFHLPVHPVHHCVAGGVNMGADESADGWVGGVGRGRAWCIRPGSIFFQLVDVLFPCRRSATGFPGGLHPPIPHRGRAGAETAAVQGISERTRGVRGPAAALKKVLAGKRCWLTPPGRNPEGGGAGRTWSTGWMRMVPGGKPKFELVFFRQKLEVKIQAPQKKSFFLSTLTALCR